MENMDGDYFVPGTELLENGPKIWQDIQAGFVSMCSKRYGFVSNVLRVQQ